MLRLRHRMMWTPTTVAIDLKGRLERPEAFQYFEQVRLPDIIRQLRSEETHSVIIDEIAEFHRQSTQVLTRADFTCIVPPYPATFVEWQDGDMQMGWMLNSLCSPGEEPKEVAEDYLHRHLVQVPLYAMRAYTLFGKKAWVIDGIYFEAGRATGGRPICKGHEICLLVDESGKLLHVFEGSVAAFQRCTRDLEEAAWKAACPALLALAFVNCRGAVVTDTTKTDGPEEKWLRRQRVPMRKYSTLHIKPPLLRRLQVGVQSPGSGGKRARHSVREHIAVYTAERPLFGKYTGPVRRQAHYRGDIAFGEIIKDYMVHPPSADEEQS